MSTPFSIGIENENGTVTSVYGNWDGGGWWVAPILSTAYRETRKIKRLISLGDISSLGVNIGIKHSFDHPLDNLEYDIWKKTYGEMTTYYKRDGGEKHCRPITHPSIRAFKRYCNKNYISYNYLWTITKKWYVCNSEIDSGLFLQSLSTFLQRHWEEYPNDKKIYDKFYNRFEKRLKR